MQIYDDQKQRIGILSGFRERQITRTLDSGDVELSFEYPASGKLAGSLKEENYIRTKTDEFVIKAVESGEEWNKYTAVLNVEELEGTQFPYGFESKEQSIRACLTFAFEGTGWSVRTCTVTKKRTIDENDKVSAWDILQKCLSTYRCECVIDSLGKAIDIHEQIGSDKGCYFIEGLNLKRLSLKSDTYEFYTRIYPIGKDGITSEWLTGQDYIDNFQYSNKIKAYVWKDERYTNTTSLIEDATAKLEEMSRPYRAFTAEIADLAKISEKHKDILSYSLGDTITLVSKKNRTREKQRIVKIVEYPEAPEKNTIEISNVRKTFAQIQKEETQAAAEEAVSISTRATKKILESYATTDEVETKITASKTAVELGVKETLKSYVTTSTYESDIRIMSDEITSKVAEDDFGTCITQNAQSVKVAWNKNSNYIQLEEDGITLYNGTIDSNQKRTVFNYTGEHFYRDGYYIGKIGTNNMTGSTSQKGLVFDMENETAYMTWAYRSTKDAATYDMKWSYCSQQCGNYAAGMLHAGADIDMHYFKLRNVSWEDGGVNATINFVQVLEMNSDGTVARWGDSGMMRFQNGILTDLTYY